MKVELTPSEIVVILQALRRHEKMIEDSNSLKGTELQKNVIEVTKSAMNKFTWKPEED